MSYNTLHVARELGCKEAILVTAIDYLIGENIVYGDGTGINDDGYVCPTDKGLSLATGIPEEEISELLARLYNNSIVEVQFENKKRYLGFLGGRF